MVAKVRNLPDLARDASASGAERLAYVALAAAALGVLLLARELTADPRGLGTHQQLGLPVCAWYSETGRPCITCGVTTAFVLVAQGRLVDGLVTQPLGAALALGAGATVLAAGYAAWYGLSLVPLLAPLWRPSIVLGGVALVLLSWGYKMAVCR
jgi:hypothetical protein